MTDAPVFMPQGTVETRQERALRRVQQLYDVVQSAFEVLAEIYRDEDWRYVNDAAGHPYTGFTAFVQDQLGCVASNARRYQQGIVGLVLPLRELVVPGTRIPVSSSDVARLGITGARVVVEQAPAVLEGIAEPELQAEALRKLIESVKGSSAVDGFGPLSQSSIAQESPLGALVPSAVPDQGSYADDAEAGDDRNAPFGGGDSSDDDPPWDAGPPNPVFVSSHPAGEAASASDSPTAPNRPPKGAPVSQSTTRGGASQVLVDLQQAIEAVLAAGDPAALAAQLADGPATALAPKCVASGQRLLRLGQLLRTV